MKLTKKFIPLLLTLCFLLNLVVVPTVAATEAVTPTENWLEGNLEINNAADLMAFSKALADGETFAGQTVTLKANVNLNPDFDGTMFDTVDVKNVWGYDLNSQFAGTFEGGGYTISGIYQYATQGYGGIFGAQLKNGTAVIRNLAITNSLVVTSAINGGGLYGLVAASGIKKLTLENLYVDVNIHSVYTNGGTSGQGAAAFNVGGLIGSQGSSALNEGALANEVIIRSVVYAGDISFVDATINDRVGGFIGEVASANVGLLIEKSAFYGKITVGTSSAYLSGFVGVITGKGGVSPAYITIQNSIAAGTIKKSSGTASCNTTNVTNAATSLTLNGCYYTSLVGEGTKTDVATVASGTTVNGSTSTVLTSAGTANTYFVNAAAIIASQTVPTGFTKQNGALPLPTDAPTLKIQKVSNATNWYTEQSANSKMTISDLDDLTDFSAALATGKNFKGKTVVLANDIDLNPGFDGTAATLDKVTNYWFFSGNGNSFLGTFNGQNHKISGIYQYATNGYAGIFGGQLANCTVTVQNLAIDNSYIVSGGQHNGAIYGLSTAGDNTTPVTMTLNNLNIDVNLHVTYTNDNNSDTQTMTGGLIGKVGKYDTATVTNCTFTGDIDFTDATHIGRAGGLVGMVEYDATTLNMTNSAFYGTITLPGTMGSYIGGLVGLVTEAFAKNSVVLNNCVSAGKISAVSFNASKSNLITNSNVGGVFVLTNCYATQQYVENGTPLTTVDLHTTASAESVVTDCDTISELPDACHWQYKSNGATADLRFVATVNTLDHEGVGLEIACSNGKTYFAGENAVIETAYTKITGDNETYTAGEGELAGGKYIIMVIITGVDATDASDALTFTVKPYTVVDGVRVYGESETMTWDGIPAEN